MTQNELFALLKEVIASGLSAGGIMASVDQSYQPTQQGVPTGPAVFIHSVGPARRYGSMRRNDTWDALEGEMVHTETQQMEQTFQVTTLVTQDPQDDTDDFVTATDLAYAVSQALQSDIGLNALRAGGCGIYRITDIRTPQFVDDRNRFEYSPSFDFTLTYRNVSISESNVIESIEYDVKRV